MSAATEELTNEQKAAMLLVLLGEDVSQLLMGHMTKREVARLARGVAETGPIDSQTATLVLQQYYERALNAPAACGGPDFARRLLSMAKISEDLVDQLIQEPKKKDDDELGPLLEAQPEVLARALEEEHPQTTALVLLQLPPKRAAQLLAALPEDKRGKTVLRMAQVLDVSGEILSGIAESLRERLSSLDSNGDGGGIQRTAEVLSAMPRADSKRLLDELEPDHPEHVEQLRDNLYTFESLMTVDARGMQELLRSVDGARVAIALDGMPEELMEKFFNNLSERGAARLKEDMEMNGNVPEDEKELARKEILGLALQLEADGKLQFAEDGNG